jgi:prefoldin subunit 5
MKMDYKLLVLMSFFILAVFSFSLSKTVVAPICGNNICESESGENSINCPQDCGNPQWTIVTDSGGWIPPPTLKFSYITTDEARKMIDEKISEVRSEINNIKNEIAGIKNETNSRINATNELIEKRLNELEKRISKIEELLKNIVKQLELLKEVKVKLEAKKFTCNLSDENEGLVLDCSQSLQPKIENVNQRLSNITENNTAINKNNTSQTQNFVTASTGLFSFVKRIFSSLSRH